MSWKPLVKVYGESKFTENGLRFATQEESDHWLSDLSMRWTMYDEGKSEECNDPVNYRIVNGLLSAVKPETDKETGPRSLRVIALEIRQDWKNVYFGAVPYLDTMSQLDSIEDNYYADSGKSIVLYFLSNAMTWRGEVAKRIKKELKAMAGVK